jgi:predicted metal-dependent phosphoesterase TrpH
MNKAYTIVFVLLLCAGNSSAQKQYYKGNTHSHSYPQSSDVTNTAYTPTNIIAQYKALGYSFMAFTDHVAFWNSKNLSTPDFTVISGEEAGLSGNGRWGHYTALNIRSQIGSTGKTHQQLIEEITSQGGITFMNHPRYSAIPITAAQIINDMKQNLNFVEVYNAETDTPTRFDTSVWDSVLTTGRTMYGVACDDSHAQNDQGRAWIMVYASSIHQDTLLRAIRNGDFYASTGIVVDSVSIARSSYFVKTTNGTRITFVGREGKILQTTDGSSATYTIAGDEGYVRAQISNTLNQTAWTQPIMLNTTSVKTETQLAPSRCSLLQNYPNPFNPSTTISFSLPFGAYVTLKIFDALGQVVSSLASEELQTGQYTRQWNATKFPSGIYFYRLQAGMFTDTKKLLLIR